MNLFDNFGFSEINVQIKKADWQMNKFRDYEFWILLQKVQLQNVSCLFTMYFFVKSTLFVHENS